MTKGIEVTESGVSIPNAIDSQKIVDSRWRTFELVDEVVMSLPTLVQVAGAQVIYEHKLGFLPAFDVYDTVLGSYITTASAVGAGLVSDNNRIYFNSFYTDPGWSNHKVVIRIYNLPITDEYFINAEQTLPVQPSSKSHIGVMAARSGTDFHHSELSEFSVNTLGKTLSVQRTGLVTASSGTNFQAVITHNMGLPPTFLATYADPQRQWVSVINPDFLPALGKADNSVLTFSGAQSALGGTLAYVIFKELGDFAI